MNRTIKFRVWHPPITDGEVTLPGHMDYNLVHRKLVSVKTETRQIPAEFGFEHIQHGLYFINKDLADYGDRLMQFTGLKDKNSKDIYEGDIVSDGDKKIDIKWEENIANCGCCYSIWAFGYDFGEMDMKKIEVIGNVWEHPELLEN